jgi:5-methylcytosine-specific restriction endonuclease McrA
MFVAIRRTDWEAAKEFYAGGHSVRETCNRFGISARAWQRAVEEGLLPAPDRPPMRPSEKRALIDRLFRDRYSQAMIAAELGISKATVSYHARRVGLPVNEAFARRYDWEGIQRAHDGGMGALECCRHFGFVRATWSKAVATGRIVPREWRIPLEELLVRGRRTSRGHLKSRLISAGLKEERCERCGLTDWRGKPLGLQLHHKNGVGDDNRLPNLEILCPNCHAQTDTWGGRNGHRKPERHLKLVPPPADSDQEEVG